MSEEKDIIKATFYGFNIYRHILESYYPCEEAIKVENGDCLPAQNPFNQDRPTLIIYRGDRQYLYRDEEIRDLKGGPLEFAALHFKMKGRELLIKINDELKLNVIRNDDFATGKKGKQAENNYIEALPKFTFFKAPISNTKPYKDINVLDVFKVIKGEWYEKRTLELRGIDDRLDARVFKARNFDYVCFSGTFSKRGDAFLKQHSNLMVLDFDHVNGLEEVKKALLADPFFDTELLFRSPSGNGLKWLITINTIECSHGEWFKAIEGYVKRTYDLTADKSGKDISRACFLPFDPDIYINPQYLGKEYQIPAINDNNKNT